MSASLLLCSIIYAVTLNTNDAFLGHSECRVKANCLLKDFSSLFATKDNEYRVSWIPKEVEEISDEYAINHINNLRIANVIVPQDVSKEPVPTSYTFYSKLTSMVRSSVPIVLIHGFDSSSLEFRRIAPKLGMYADVYVPDIVGWGFTDTTNVKSVSPAAKLEHLKCFLEQVVKHPAMVIGASLGGGIAINLATEICPDFVHSLVLIDAQVDVTLIH